MLHEECVELRTRPHPNTKTQRWTKTAGTIFVTMSDFCVTRVNLRDVCTKWTNHTRDTPLERKQNVLNEKGKRAPLPPHLHNRLLVLSKLERTFEFQVGFTIDLH